MARKNGLGDHPKLKKRKEGEKKEEREIIVTKKLPAFFFGTGE